MVDPKKEQEQQPEEQDTRKADADSSNLEGGQQGYGQPPKDVSDKPLPDQKWGGRR
ncbi:hypothetical protein [Archangium primigenium]|jgi:hypothetical protein|uniref:hypothetical protein n=1 Tax=[Archangium] primigenium TaxID=2792470 RepID=UPI00195F1F93|nr:hypothetical protein [Archangium primigenium]MBM7115316.1 hypothetical protein [Archangium primigenium]